MCLFLCIELFNKKGKETKEIETSFVSDTVFVYDTVVYKIPFEVDRIVLDTVRIVDTFMVKEQSIYNDTSYTAWVSGYDARLDSIYVYPRTETISETKTIYVPKQQNRKPFGVGVQVGFGYPHGAYVGIGISYNIINW